MGYKLRSDLSKTAVYQLCQQYVEGIQMPKLRDCDYKKSRGTYWLSFALDLDSSYEVCFSAFAGSCHVRVTRLEYTDDCRRVQNQLSFQHVPFDYLLSNGYLREVAA